MTKDNSKIITDFTIAHFNVNDNAYNINLNLLCANNI